MSRARRAGFVIACGTLDGNTFNWNSFQWEEPKP